MPGPDTNSVLKILREAATLAHNVGLPKQAAKFEELHARFQKQKPTFKALRTDGEAARLELSNNIKPVVLDDQNQVRPGMEPFRVEYYRISDAIQRLQYPPLVRVPEADIKGFAGTENVPDKSVKYYGDVLGVRSVVESTLEFVRHYADVLGSGNFLSAYALTDFALQARMSYAEFLAEHQAAEKMYHGPCLEFELQCLVYVLTDEAGRKNSNQADDRWPKSTPQETRRSAVNGFWIRDRPARTGSGGILWLAEENHHYRLAKFEFFIP